MSVLRISSATFAENGKRGEMVPDSNGYYDVILGGLNVYNTRNEYYSARECMDLFKSSSILMRRVKKKALYAENGHPKLTPGMSHSQFYERVLTIDEKNVCAHIGEISLDTEFGKNNPGTAQRDTIAILGKIAPAGPFANVIERAVKNKLQNLAFSIRSITDNEQLPNGQIEKHLKNIITFDYVTEGGIVFADKQYAPSLESHQEVVVDRELMKEVIEDIIPFFGLEDSEMMIHESVLETISRTKEIKKKDRRIFLL